MPPHLQSRLDRLAAALPLGDTLLLVGAGEPVPLPEGSDQTYPFRAHAEYFYLTDTECAGGVVAFDPAGGGSRGWVHFVPTVTEAERVWEGRPQPEGTPLGELPGWLAARRGRPVANLGAPVPGVATDASLTPALREAFTHARRAKQPEEIARIRAAAAATAAGFHRIRELLQPGITERTLQIELEAEFRRAGGTRPGFHTIVGTGPNAAVLHFEPSGRAAQPGELVLIDAGAEVDRYTADVTRTFTVGTADPFRRDLHAAVLRAQERAIARCVPGAEWKAVHLDCAADLMEGLAGMGLVHGRGVDLVARDAHTLFFPHGLGHLVGLGVRDGSGLQPGRTKDPRPSLRALRMDLPLASGYVVTVEPGLYFIPALLQDPIRRDRYRDCVNWSLVDRHLDAGGVRIEDDILVGDGSPENLTRAISKAP